MTAANDPSVADEKDPALFRAMKMNEDGTPVHAPNQLGVRIPTDIQPDGEGRVWPESGGLSVTPSDATELPLHHRPIGLGGTGRRPIWMIRPSLLGDSLVYRQDSQNPAHGYLEPSRMMPLIQYEKALAETANSWEVYHD